MPVIKPASTVLVVKDHPVDGIRILLLKRNSKLNFAPDYWVFPGGRIDTIDGIMNDAMAHQTAQKAAVREAYEEAQLELDPNQLELFCHWTTPSGGNKRFSTWFFCGHYGPGNKEVQIDQSEIVDYKWIHPQHALNELSNRKLNLLPPTFVTLNRIKKARTYRDVREEFARTGIVRAKPVTILENGKFFCLYQGDAGYDAADILQTSSKHRLVIDQNNGTFDFEYEHCEHIPPVNGGVNF